MKIRLYIFLLVFLLLLSVSCSDIIDCDSNIDKRILFKKLTAEDTLDLLDIHTLDFGAVKMRTVCSMYASMANKSDSVKITVYSLKSKDTRGLYSYTYPAGIPFDILPGEDIDYTGKIRVKFIADAFNTGFYYDTLIINDNVNYYIPVVSKIKY